MSDFENVKISKSQTFKMSKIRTCQNSELSDFEIPVNLNRQHFENVMKEIFYKPDLFISIACT